MPGFTVNWTKEQFDKIDNRAKSLGVTKSEYVRMCHLIEKEGPGVKVIHEPIEIEKSEPVNILDGLTEQITKDLDV